MKTANLGLSSSNAFDVILMKKESFDEASADSMYLESFIRFLSSSDEYHVFNPRFFIDSGALDSFLNNIDTRYRWYVITLL